MIIPLLLACVLLLENSDRLEIYVVDQPIAVRDDAGRFIRGEDGSPVIEEKLIEISCEVFPQTLTVGDRLYVKPFTKNISQETLEYRPIVCTLGADPSVGRFIYSPNPIHTRIRENSSRGLNENLPDEGWENLQIYPGIPLEQLMPGTQGQVMRLPIKTLMPGDTLISGTQSFFLPFPGEYDRQFWTDLSIETIMLLRFRTDLSGRVPTATRPRTPGGVRIYPELKIRPRPEVELQLIKEWYDKTHQFVNLSPVTGSPKPAEWQEFEEKLTPGTLRNHIRMLRTLVEITQDENKGKRQAMFNEMLKWFDELHPHEKEGLTQQAYEKVKERQQRLDNEIALPVVSD